MITSGRLPLLTDEQWARLAPFLPRNVGKKGRPFADRRRIIDGIIYRYRTSPRPSSVRRQRPSFWNDYFDNVPQALANFQSAKHELLDSA
ncbi:transposase [Streptomyces sp. NPDC002671]